MSARDCCSQIVGLEVASQGPGVAARPRVAAGACREVAGPGLGPEGGKGPRRDAPGWGWIVEHGRFLMLMVSTTLYPGANLVLDLDQFWRNRLKITKEQLILSMLFALEYQA
jgi:hypothetical protein